MADLEELPDATDGTTVTTPVAQIHHSTSHKKREKTTNPQTVSEFSIRKPDWAHLHFQHVAPGGRSTNSSNSSLQPLDGVTAHLHLTAALSSFLGTHGAAIPIDITKLEGREVWIRVPADDRVALIAAAGGWISGSGESWRVKGWSHWNANACGRDAGQDLFGD